MYAELEQKIGMYKALRSVKEKMDLGRFNVLDKDGKIDLKESVFLINRVVTAIAIANTDPELQEIKQRLDESKGSQA